jgi:DNA-directed RNA polymerase specialized sigma24 family protein
MVLSVGRRVLGNLHDAEDALQVTFLALAHKTPSVSPSTSLSWLRIPFSRTML